MQRERGGCGVDAHRGRVMTRGLRTLGLSLALVMSRGARADEGQWTPEQISALDFDALQRRGLELPARALWNAQDGGLMRAVVNLGGCTASFISPRGLLATNHHCAYGALQAQSTVERDLLTEGFVARAEAEELEARGKTVRVLEEVVDVSARVREAADAARDDATRHRAIERARKQLVQDCEAERARRRCQVASFYGGSQYQLMIYFELRDVRLVYAPPAAVGEFGGEIDNWMWPRHTGDFSLLRAYVGPDGQPADFAQDNVPYAPPTWLRVSGDGIAPGDFVAVMGYPGSTQRYLPAVEVARQVEQALPSKVELYGRWIDILERLGARDPAIKIKVAATKKSLANRHKNARGMLDGIRRMGLVARREREDAAVRAWARAPGREPYARALAELDAMSDALRRVHAREFVLTSARGGPNLLAVAVDLILRARAHQKPDLERDWELMERNASRLWSQQERRLRDFDAEVDAQLLAALLVRAAALPDDQAIAAFAPLIARASADADADASDLGPYLEGARDLFRASPVRDLEWVRARFDAAEPAALVRAAARDPLLALAHELADALERQDELEHARAGLRARALPRYFELLEQQRGGPVYPDANGTLRFSFAEVTGYRPEEGLIATPQTTLAGQVAKDQGTDPFALPEVVRAAAPAAAGSEWADPGLGSVPLCFLSNADTTGGNSGSPVINGRGELVGLNFDRVWENIAGDFGYAPARSRNISVDARYLLWSLDRVANAESLLRELDVARGQATPSSAGAGEALTATRVDAAAPDGASPAAGGCACAASSTRSRERDAGRWLCLALALVPLVFRRRR